jgi:hypothetical protein
MYVEKFLSVCQGPQALANFGHDNSLHAAGKALHS